MLPPKFNAFMFAAFVGAACVGNVSAQVTLPEVVETAQISTDAFSTGTLEVGEGALSPDIWTDTRAETLEFLLDHMPTRPGNPSLGAALKRVLLTPGTAPSEAAPSLGGKKLLALARAGLTEEAKTIASLSTNGRGDPWVEQAEAIIDLLNNDIASACRRNANLSTGRDGLFWVRLRVLCYAQAGERDAADLTFGILRDQGSLDDADAAYLGAVATGNPLADAAPIEDALQLAIASSFDLDISLQHLAHADAGVLAAVAGAERYAQALRIGAAQQAIAMGAMNISRLSGLMSAVEFDLTAIGAATETANAQPNDPMTDALLYQSVKTMSAPEFLRDKARRIALALNLADSFPRAYALSLLYADDIAALEGVLLAPDEASSFALARMAVGDSVGAGEWLSAMIGVNESVSALPAEQAIAFVARLELLALLDPQTASRIAGAADISILTNAKTRSSSQRAHHDPAVTAQILDAAFDAAYGNKTGQAALAALAASSGAADGSQVETVIVAQSLRSAGMTELQRRYEFENAWSATYATPQMRASADAGSPGQSNDIADDEGGFAPRLKPRSSQ
ncbi:MAG: hypothetical protein DHS20C05_05370 [Hyphococcus sp.]|nr:MAG: hypothetical protein DHS20C05_05370 [Marinicaulis sp.]